jgi:hypothetical protein
MGSVSEGVKRANWIRIDILREDLRCQTGGFLTGLYISDISIGTW